MKKTSLTASNNQGDKLRERVGIALEKSGVTMDKVQIALGYPGTGLEDDIVSSIIKYSNKASGIVTPISALETGLVPSGWVVVSDDLEGDIDIANLDFGYSPCEASESYISGDNMLKRATATKAIGSLGFAKYVLDEQAAGRQVIPEELQGQKYIICFRTILEGSSGRRHVAYLRWVGEQWVVGFRWIDSGFDSSDVVPRLRK